MDSKCTFSVDWEAWHDALHVKRGKDDGLLEPTLYLLKLLRHHKVKATFYVLGITKDRNEELYNLIVSDGHEIKSHGEYHFAGQPGADRQPYAILGPCGGFWMRALPYRVWKQFVLLQHHCYIHPHDIMKEHPDVSGSKGRLLNWKRQVGLKTARQKLERLLSEVSFEEPS